MIMLTTRPKEFAGAIRSVGAVARIIDEPRGEVDVDAPGLGEKSVEFFRLARELRSSVEAIGAFVDYVRASRGAR